MASTTPAPDARLIAALRAARDVMVLTGAGISAESGLPTFRDALTGYWATFRPEDLATPEAFERNPATVWAWYAERRLKARSALPNPGHLALVTLERWLSVRDRRFTLVTQNVDGLHVTAGQANVIELHGSLQKVKCFRCAEPAPTWDETGKPPRCAHCGGPLRPDVVWFGEMLPVAALNAARAAAERCDVCLSIGTSGMVEPAASLPRIAAQRGATTLTLNLDVTDRATPPRFEVRARAGAFLPALVDAVCGIGAA
ncbi:MAG: NAD-dependent deacylase [Thermoflexales bacterium]|nr:NAD-dependent deacylase [Thermoflexales bacterium]